MDNVIDFSKKTRLELITMCKEKNIKGYSGNTKKYITQLLETKNENDNDETKNENVETKTNELRMVDLFAGTGAFSLAFEQTNQANIVFSNDMMDHSKKICDENFSHKLTLKNLNEINVEYTAS